MNEKKLRIKSIKYRQKIEKEPPGPPEYDYYIPGEIQKLGSPKRGKKNRLVPVAIIVLAVLLIASNIIMWHSIRIAQEMHNEYTATTTITKYATITATLNHGEKFQNLESQIQQLRRSLILSSFLDSIAVNHELNGETLTITLILPDSGDVILDNYDIKLTILKCQFHPARTEKLFENIIHVDRNVVEVTCANPQWSPGTYITKIQIQTIDQEIIIQRTIRWDI